MECAKCKGDMKEHTLSTLSGDVTIDRCIDCRGIWFDIGEAELLKNKWMSDYIDDGDPRVGKEHNQIRDINCPRCGREMTPLSDRYRPTSSTRPAKIMACTSTPGSLPTTNTKPLWIFSGISFSPSANSY